MAPAVGVNVKFLAAFKKLLSKFVRRSRFYIIVGGGAAARQYQKAMKESGVNNTDELDWIGIAATRLNAELVRVSLGKIACPQIILDPTKLPKSKKQVFVGGGWKPGWSTDYVAAVLAKNIGAKTVVNLSNIDYICDKDPKKFADAKPFKKMRWSDLRDLVGEKWVPGFHLPFDPKACALAKKEKMSVIFLNGNNLNNLKKFIEGKSFIGTIVE